MDLQWIRNVTRVISSTRNHNFYSVFSPLKFKELNWNSDEFEKDFSNSMVLINLTGKNNEISIMTSSILLILLYVIRPTLQFESNSFLIYNEDQKKCLQVEDSLIKVADCTEDNDAQKFHWISQYQLINVAMPQCLGVSSKKEMSLVSLSPCDGENELQRWECKNDTLFGIQGEDFYLNNGNAKNRVVTLKASNDSSRWKIYGTPDDLCVKAYEEIYTLNGNGNGQPCVFPFKFESKWYADCTTTGAKHGDLWCATTANYDKDSLWGYCPIKTSREGWWTTDSITGSQYQINGNSALTWYQARMSCHQQHAELLSITELHEQTYISGLTSATKTSLWVGLSSLDLNAGWKWNDGSPFRYLNWLPGNPSTELGKNCVSLEPTNNAKWENKECSQKLGYICKKGNITSYISPSATEPINCPPIWISYAGFCYYMYKEAKNWQDAMLSCRKEEGDLASLHNVEEASFANSNFEFEDAENVWLGLNDLKTQMFFEWSDGTPVTYTVWQRGEPSHIYDRNEDCVALNTKIGHWSDQACEKKFPYMCKRKPMPIDYDEGPVVEPGCSTGWKRHGLYCYFVGEEMSMFTEANTTCIAHASFLMTVEDRFEQAYLTSLIGLRTEKYFWIGLSDMEEKGTFKWTTKERVLYTHWDADMPGRKEGCVVMRTGNKGGLWDVINCDEKAKFVCKKLAQGVTPPPIPTTTPEPKCPMGWTTDHHISSCFNYYIGPKEERKSWFEAREFCRAIGGDLLSVNSKQDEDTLLRMLLMRLQFWIGLENSDPDEGFQWSDGSPLVYQTWSYGEPNNQQGIEHCAVLRISYSLFWNDVPCEHINDWICELKKGVELKPEPTNPPYPEFNLTADGWLIRGDRQYYVAKDAEVAMDRAQNFCRKNSSDLVTINDDDERKFLWRYILKTGKSDSYYIGMQLSVDKQFKWMDGSPVDYVAWEANEPNFSNNDENCVVLQKFSGYWNDLNCGSPWSYICEKKTSNINTTMAPTVPTPRGGCLAGWMGIKGKCYKIFGRIEEEEDHLVEWHTGRSACQQLGGNLASIHDDLVQAFLTYNLKDLKHPVWIGLNDINENSKYRWTDQSGVYYTNWANGYPNRYYTNGAKTDCVSMKVGNVMDAGTWIEVDCQLKRGYVCQKSEDPALPVVTTITPSSDQYKFGDVSYKFQKTKMNWDEAREKCKQSDYELASILESYAASFLRVQLDKFKEPFWIGLYSDNKTYNQYKWSDGWKLNYNKWAPKEPKQKNACVYFDTDGQWKTASCDEHYASFCKQTSVRPPTEPPQKPGKCLESSSVSWIPFRGHCYFLEAEKVYEWGKATINCLQNGGNLVSIEDQHEADFLFGHLVLLSDKARYFWIGAYRNVEGKWLWIDNTPMDYVNWGDGEPKERSYLECVRIFSRTGNWSVGYCSSTNAYICKTPKIPEPIANTTNPEKSEREQKPMHGIAVGVSIFIIAVIATTAIAVYLVYIKKRNVAPPAESSINNTLYISSSHDATIQDTSILVNNMEQISLAEFDHKYSEVAQIMQIGMPPAVHHTYRSALAKTQHQSLQHKLLTDPSKPLALKKEYNSEMYGKEKTWSLRGGGIMNYVYYIGNIITGLQRREKVDLF
ncbi:macrophage mannose receptor 1-like [Mantella aurantiaca]